MANDPLKRPLGPTGEAVRANIIRLRAERRLGYTELSEKLKDIGRHILPIGLRRIENGARRVDVDDLNALALALDVTPLTLLMPEAADAVERVEITGAAGKCDAEQVWNWLCAQEPIASDVDTVEFRMAAYPAWKKRQMLANIKHVTVNFGSEGGLKTRTRKAK